MLILITYATFPKRRDERERKRSRMWQGAQAEIGARLSHLKCVLCVSNGNTGIFFKAGRIHLMLGRGISRGCAFPLKIYLNERKFDAFERETRTPVLRKADVSMVSFAYIQLRVCAFGGTHKERRGAVGRRDQVCARQDCAQRQGRPSKSVT